ncbi:hypothetical protein MXD60_07795 [Frankia sp. AgB32]|nr:hypothetical protein [Frankia sp. AgB32]MCK9894504.1 hypothetical protein [Frankia sp. AgB32]
MLRSRADYFRARRPGRGRQLARQDRDAILQRTERFTKRAGIGNGAAIPQG